MFISLCCSNLLKDHNCSIQNILALCCTIKLKIINDYTKDKIENVRGILCIVCYACVVGMEVWQQKQKGYWVEDEKDPTH